MNFLPYSLLQFMMFIPDFELATKLNQREKNNNTAGKTTLPQDREKYPRGLGRELCIDLFTRLGHNEKNKFSQSIKLENFAQVFMTLRIDDEEMEAAGASILRHWEVFITIFKYLRKFSSINDAEN